MGDEETGTASERAESAENVDTSPTPRHQREKDLTGMFSLPPISLPEMEFPDRLQFLVPEPPTRDLPSLRLRLSWVVAIVLALDLLDAAVVALAGAQTLPWLRALVGLGVSAVVVGPAGLLYGWELIATLAGFGGLALAPTATVLLLGRLALRRV